MSALTVFDDGTGAALYAGGFFTTAEGSGANNIAKWNGTAWSPLGSGFHAHEFSGVSALTVFDDGTGPALYVGGEFTTAGSVSANNIAKWNGSAWSPLGSGLGGTEFPDVSALTVFDDGTGPALYVVGDFATAGGGSANKIAKWNGSAWSPLGNGVGGMFESVSALTVFDDGAGPALYLGGEFTTAGGVSANNVAKWNGTAWSPLGSGISGGSFPQLWDLTVFDDGTGPALYAGGRFTTAGKVSANNIAKWNGSAWSTLGSGMDPRVCALTVFDDGSGSALYTGGLFATAAGVSANNIAKWNGSAWSALPGAAPGSGMGGGNFAFERQVSELTVFDDGTGPSLYAGGGFTTAGGVGANRIAKWNGSAWSPLGTGMNESVVGLTVFDDGTGSALYAGGFFTTAGGVSANRIARWNGSAWSALGSGINGFVLALTVFDDGTGPALYAGGRFTTAGGASATNIAKWNGSVWSRLGSELSPGFVNTSVRALTVFDDGTGPALYAGGFFRTAAGISAHRIDKWNGSVWSPLGSALNSQVDALTVFDDGTGPAIYAGGDFTLAGGIIAPFITKWNGSAWSALGSGMSGPVQTLIGFASSAEFVGQIRLG